MKKDVFDRISPSEALEILRQIAEDDKNLKKKIVELAEDLFGDVDMEEICEAVFCELDGIDVHELWDHAGPTRDGYVSTEELSAEMFEEALEPFLQELYRLFDLKMHREAKLYCMGVLKGIHQYEENSGSEFKDWADDIPEARFMAILDKWKERHSTIEDKKEMKDFICNECPNWSKWAIKTI